MRLMCPLIPLAMALSMASTRTVREYQNAHGVVRVTVIPDVRPRGDSSVSDSGSASASVSDSASAPVSVLAALPDLDLRAGALLEIYFLDKDDGRELRFPVKYSQLSAFGLSHAAMDPGASGVSLGGPSTGPSADDKAVDLIRGFSRELRIHMKTPGAAGGKP